MGKKEQALKKNRSITVMKKKDSKAVPYLFLFISLSVLAAAVYGMTFRSRELEDLTGRLFSSGTPAQPIVATYLSSAAKSTFLREAYELLETEVKKLAEVQNMKRRLDNKRDLFIERMAEKEERYDAGMSAFPLEEILGDLRAAGYLDRYRSRFAGDLGRRMEIFFKMYETQRTALLREEASVSGRIDELTRYIELVTEKTVPVMLFDGGEVLESTRKQYSDRAAFLIGRGEYDRARTLLSDAGFGVQESLLLLLLETASELQRKNEDLEEKDPLLEIKMSYFSEEYHDVISLANSTKDDSYIGPLLSELTDASRTNIEIQHEIMRELELKEDITVLFARARRMEARGEYAQACDLYRKLLLLDLSPFDAEHIVTRMTSCITGSAIADEKRKDNTEAIRLLEEARGLQWNGKKRDAIDLYKNIILRCPNSDYIGQALDELEKLLV